MYFHNNTIPKNEYCKTARSHSKQLITNPLKSYVLGTSFSSNQTRSKATQYLGVKTDAAFVNEIS